MSFLFATIFYIDHTLSYLKNVHIHLHIQTHILVSTFQGTNYTLVQFSQKEKLNSRCEDSVEQVSDATQISSSCSGHTLPSTISLSALISSDNNFIESELATQIGCSLIALAQPQNDVFLDDSLPA